MIEPAAPSGRSAKPAGRTLVIGLTGGIACGKTMVSRALARRGAQIVDADAVSRDIMRPGRPVARKVAELFGPAVVKRNGAIDRRKLGTVVFADPSKRRALEQVTHPAIIAGIRRRVSELKREGVRIVVVAAPLLYEAHMESMFDAVIAVWAPAGVQAERLMLRDRLDKGAARARIRSQMPAAEKRRRADMVVDNSGSRAMAGGEIKKIWQLLTKD